MEKCWLFTNVPINTGKCIHHASAKPFRKNIFHAEQILDLKVAAKTGGISIGLQKRFASLSSRLPLCATKLRNEKS